jgi:hypothetical protein
VARSLMRMIALNSGREGTTSTTESVHKIIFKHAVILINHFICRGGLGGAASCRVPRLAVCYVVVYYSCLSMRCFNLIRPSSDRLFMSAALYCF